MFFQPVEIKSLLMRNLWTSEVSPPTRLLVKRNCSSKPVHYSRRKVPKRQERLSVRRCVSMSTLIHLPIMTTSLKVTSLIVGALSLKLRLRFFIILHTLLPVSRKLLARPLFNFATLFVEISLSQCLFSIYF